jgi:basic amino acid/polyamine antiporter, APA family
MAHVGRRRSRPLVLAGVICSLALAAACDDETTPWKILCGYRFNQYFAIEASYIDWGKVTGTIRNNLGQIFDVSADQTSLGIAAIGSVPITRQLSIFGKLGRLRTEQETRSVSATSTQADDDAAGRWHGDVFELTTSARLSFPRTGGPYAYVEVAFGSFVGYLLGVLLWLQVTVAFAAVATIFADNVGRLVPALAGGGARAGLLVAVLAILAGTNVAGVRQGSRVNVVSAIVKLAPLFLLIVGGVFAIDPDNLRGVRAPSVGDLSRASIFLNFAFAGIESALMPSGEVREPARTVPRAIFLAMGLVTVIYLLTQIVAQGTLGPALVGSPTPLADAAGRVFGPWGAALLSAGVVLSTLGYLSGMTLAVPRSLYAFARDGFLPRKLAAVPPRFHTPHVAIVVQSVVVVLLALTSGFEALALIATSATLIVYLGCCMGAWELRRRNVRGAGEPFAVPGAAFVPFLAAIVILYLLSSVTLREWSVLAATVAIATLVFYVTRKRRGMVAPVPSPPAA